MPSLKLLLLSSAACFAVAGFLATAHAQEAEPVEESEDEADIETMVVTGFRRSIEDALQTKRNADALVESISAEDIGRLPDISIAEALARLPGIAAQRTSGQASAINIRGLSQQLTFSTLNGREQVTPNGNRSVEFEQFPSELLGGVDVYKTPQAELVEGGLAGTVDLRTLRPLDRKDATFVFNMRGSFNDRANEIFDTGALGYRLSAAYVNQFADDTIGVSIGYARLVQPDVSTRFVGFDYDNFAPLDFNGDGTNDNLSFGFELEEQGGRDVRDGIIGTVQFEPNENISWTTDAYYSRFDSTGFGRGFRVIGPQSVNGGTTILEDPIVAGSAVVGGRFIRNTGAPTTGGGFGLTVQGINDNQRDEDELISIGSQFDVTAGAFTFSVDGTYSRADSSFANEVSAILPISSLDGGVPGVTFDAAATPVLFDEAVVDYQLNGLDIATINEISPSLTDRSLQRLSRFGAFPFDNDDRVLAIRGDVEYEADMPIFSSLQAGFRFSDRDASQFRESVDFGNDAGFFQFAENELIPIELTDENSRIECFSGDFARAGFPCFVVIPDPAALVEEQVGEIVLTQNQGFTRSDSFDLEEQTIAGYVQANLDTEIFGIPMRGNLGVRVFRTEQSSFNTEVQQATGVASLGVTYTRVLPSANFVFELTDKDILRFSGSRAIARPPITQLGSGISLGVNATAAGGFEIGGGGAGNPALLPFLANQGDISYEHYFDNGGAIVLAGFYKALDTFIVSDNDENFDFEAAGLLPLIEDDVNFPLLDGNFIGNFGGPINGEGGFVRGFEFAYTQVFEFLPPLLDGLGVQLNYSFTDSEIDFTATNSGESLTLPLPGLSDHVFNGTVFYEVGTFANRVGIRYRSEFVSPQTGINTQLPLTGSEVVVDYQASYDIELPNEFGALTLLFQANNLTDAPVRTFFGNEAQTGTVQFFGRQFFFGFSYRY